MATLFPGSLDAFTNPTSTSLETDHALQHQNHNDSISALETKVGVTGSAVTSTHDYKLSGVTGADKAASLAGTEALTNKTINGFTVTSTGGTIDALIATDHTTGRYPISSAPAGDLCKVTNSANISIANTTDTVVTFDTETYDTNGMHSTSVNTSRVTAQRAGTYFITGFVRFAASATGIRGIAFKKNGSFQNGDFSVNGTATRGTGLQIQDIITLSVNDYIEINVWQNSGGALNLEATACYLIMQQLY